jgi:uncharacterized protein YbjT (DUF2867 family)
MRIAITGASGFVGHHLARQLSISGHELVLIGRTWRHGGTLPNATLCQASLADINLLERAFAGCDAVAHCAGINREIGNQTYERVHIEGTANVVKAARMAGASKIALMSFLRARPNCGSKYHESKWAAEEIVRSSGLKYIIVKASMIFGRGDHMLDHLSHSISTFPLIATVGFRQKNIRPVAIDDLVRFLDVALTDPTTLSTTIALVGPEELQLSDAVRRVAHVLRKRVFLIPAPVWFHYVLAQVFEWTMKVPLVAKAQIRILSEGVVEPAMACDPIPSSCLPIIPFHEAAIRKGLPEPGRFGVKDLRCCLTHES